jgi:hypothetical protein
VLQNKDVFRENETGGRVFGFSHRHFYGAVVSGKSCPHYPTFSFASPKEKVAKRKGDFLPIAPRAKK